MRCFSLFALSLVVCGGIVGCGESAHKPPAAMVPAGKPAGHDHGGWWCTEHGVPEHVCGLCDAKLAAQLKAKGDWCKEHDRPDSQCFTCHPELEAVFAAEYTAKYGKQPPARDEG